MQRGAVSCSRGDDESRQRLARPVRPSADGKALHAAPGTSDEQQMGAPANCIAAEPSAWPSRSTVTSVAGPRTKVPIPQVVITRPSPRQRRQRVPDRVPADPEPLRQRRLRRQRLTAAQLTSPDLFRKMRAHRRRTTLHPTDRPAPVTVTTSCTTAARSFSASPCTQYSMQREQPEDRGRHSCQDVGRQPSSHLNRARAWICGRRGGRWPTRPRTEQRGWRRRRFRPRLGARRRWP